MSQTPTVVYVDARALQDPDYRFRGVGQHSSTLIEAIRTASWDGQRPRLVGVTDVGREELHAVHRRLFDSIITRPIPEVSRKSETVCRWFITLSPMTHDPTWAAAFLEDASIYRIALFYDLIQLDFPDRYLSVPELRINFLICLAWLRRYDTFAAISQHTRTGLTTRMQVKPEKVFVSGVAVRQSLEPPAGEVPLAREDRQWIVVSGGGDPRKNPECALIAHATSSSLRKAGLGIVVFGNYPNAMRADMRTMYAERGGNAADLVFQPHIPDADLRQIYRKGLVTIVPSRAEGFSIPIIESSAAGTPVIASDVGAHPELIRQAEWRFDPDQPDSLRMILERLSCNGHDWENLRNDQANLWKSYTAKKVGRCFVEGVIARAPATIDAPFVHRGVKPSMAVLTPLPPAHSGVADYTAVTLRPLKDVVDLHMFTSTAGATWEKGWASLNDIAVAEMSPTRFDATLSIIGNSFHHTKVLDFLLAHSGACIAHDARQVDFYFHERGHASSIKVAESELGRTVKIEEIAHWIRNQRELPTLFLSEIARASSPLMIHSATTGALIKKMYGVDSIVLPFAQYRPGAIEARLPENRKFAREQLDIDTKTLLLTTFGIISDDKAPEELVWTLRSLLRWGVKAQLAFCGLANEPMAQLIETLAQQLGVQEHIRVYRKVIDDKTYSDYLAAADVGIQLRTYHMGGLSGALNDCIAAALPTISNSHLAEAMDAPRFVRRIPDGLSSILIAEAALTIIESGDNLKRPQDEAEEFTRTHSASAYCRKLLAGMELDVEIASS